jgi:mannonate dehydratase
MRHSGETDRVFPHSYTFADGTMLPGDKPGFCVDIAEALAAQFPHYRAYLPINRKLDGTMRSW